MKNNVDKESKRQKFARLAENRVNQALDCFRKLGKLSDTRNYAYSEEDINKIFSVLLKEIKKTKARFSAGIDSDFRSFKL